MGATRIKDLDNTSSVFDTDAIAIDGTQTGTKKITFSSLWKWIIGRNYAFNHGTKSISTAINDIDARIDSLSGGSPEAVNTASQMTDTSRAYIYTGTETGYTAGHWYYHNGSAWVDAGVYGSSTPRVVGTKLYL